MGKGMKKTLTTIMVMVVMAGMILFLYRYISQRPDLMQKKPSEVETLLKKDLKLYYPATPKEVVRLLSDMWKVLYTDLKDKEVDALAQKMRELYDPEFIQKNPQDKYIKNLYSEIAIWRKDKRTISNYLFGDEKQNETSVKDGQKYATIYVSYTIAQKGKKYVRDCKFVLRKSKEEQWKILGWKFLDNTSGDKGKK
jgi:hypothetical protein